MKVLLSLAFMCCFVGGIVGTGCNCGPLEECYDKNKYVVKAKVEEIETHKNYVDLKINEKQDFKKENDFEYVRVPKDCERNFKKDKTYLFMGNRKTDTIMRIPVDDGFIKRWKTVSDHQKNFLTNNAQDS